MEQNNGDADGAIAEENGDAEVTHVQKRKRLNFSQKLALAILGTFMVIISKFAKVLHSSEYIELTRYLIWNRE